jgi:hypothetical protein
MTLIHKLKIKHGKVGVINSPPEILDIFQPFMPASTIPARAKECFDFVLLFVTTSRELEPAWKRIIPALKGDAVFWVAYPKKSSGIPSDLAGMSGDWDVYSGSPWQPVAGASIDDRWTGIRFRFAPGLESERRERPSQEIGDADGTLVVDRVNRVVHPPKDLAAVLARHPEARAFFDRLSFTHQREYVTWIVEAKKDETRRKRVASTLERLVSSKKSPSEK